MGSGASSFGTRASTSSYGPGSPACTVTASGTTTVVDVVEGGVQWLVGLVEREKHEKEWLAARLEESGAEIRGLHKELSALRAELDSERRSKQSAAVARPGVTARSVHTAPGIPEADSSTTRQSCADAEDTQPPPKAGSLLARRGLKLGLDTSTNGRTRKGPVISPMEVVSPVLERPDAEEEALIEEVLKEHGGPVEPPSALLRRRSGQWSSQAMDSSSTCAQDTDVGPSLSVRRLQVAVHKVYNMLNQGDDFGGAASPKRVLKHRDLFPDMPCQAIPCSGGTC